MKINGKFTHVKEEIYLVKLLLNLVLMRAQNYLNKALEQNLRPILFINKIDKFSIILKFN